MGGVCCWLEVAVAGSSSPSGFTISVVALVMGVVIYGIGVSSPGGRAGGAAKPEASSVQSAVSDVPTCPQSVGPKSSADHVRLLQVGLTRSGYAVVVDGVFGVETTRQLQAYQTRNGLPLAAAADEQVVQRLQLC